VIGHRPAIQHLVGLAVFIGLAGCAVTDPTQYFTLGQTERRNIEPRPSTPTSPSSATGTRMVGIGVGPVIMPGYLDRIQVVTRTDADHVELSTFNRWAEPLNEGIARILAEEIAARVPTERIVTFPWRGVTARDIQYQVVVVVLRFDGKLGGDLTLDARWRILDRDGAELAFRRSTVTEAAAGSGYGQMVAAMTRAAVTLGQEISAEIGTVRR